MHCSFCYKQHGKGVMDRTLLMGIPKVAKQLLAEDGNIALGGGEILLHPGLLIDFGKECKKHGVVLCVTSNGVLLDIKTDARVKEMLKNVRMISMSFDKEKVKDEGDYKRYLLRVFRLRRLRLRGSSFQTEVGCNLLVDKNMFVNHNLIKIVNALFSHGVSRVFALYPKNMSLGVDILKFKEYYAYLTEKHKHFYVDDCTKQILQEGSYDNWKNTCHSGKDLISIDWDGSLSACSFAKPFGKIAKAEDLLKVEMPKEQVGYDHCPFIKR